MLYNEYVRGMVDGLVEQERIPTPVKERIKKVSNEALMGAGSALDTLPTEEAVIAKKVMDITAAELEEKINMDNAMAAQGMMSGEAALAGQEMDPAAEEAMMAQVAQQTGAVPMDPNAMPVDPNAMPADPNAMPADPNAGQGTPVLDQQVPMV